MTFQVGDRVRVTDAVFKGLTGTVFTTGVRQQGISGGALKTGDRLLVELDRRPGMHLAFYESELNRHVDTFPISADKDPWRETEPSFGELFQLDGVCDDGGPGSRGCTRVADHVGHHVARARDTGIVYCRWPQAPKPLPVETVNGRCVDIENGGNPYIWLPLIQQNSTRCLTGKLEPTFTITAPGGKEIIRLEPNGDVFVRGKLATTDADILASLTMLLRGETTTSGRLARAQFEVDHAAQAARVGDDGRGGIGKAAVLERMWTNASAEIRKDYYETAAALLKRAGEL